jgi:hypothetical protein
VYSTKDREALIPPDFEPRLYSFVAEIARMERGCGAFAVSASHVEQVKAYIRNQKEHHKKRTFEEEFVAMLKKAGVDLRSEIRIWVIARDS